MPTLVTQQIIRLTHVDYILIRIMIIHNHDLVPISL